MRKLFHSLKICLVVFLVLFSLTSYGQLASVNPPTGGFRIDGGLKANTPTLGEGDWVAGPAGTGGFVLSNAGGAVDGAFTGLRTDPFNSGADNIFTTGSKFNDIISDLHWTASTAPNKNDIDNSMYHVSKNTSNSDQWIMIGGDRLSTSGTSYIDFEFLQSTLVRNTGGTFTGGGPAGGRTVNDLLISMEYTNGGAAANVFFYQWKPKAGGGFQFVQFTPPAGTGFAMTNAANEDVPFGAFGSTTYQPFAFVEAAINVTQLLQATGDPCAGLSVNTLWVKTKASASSTAALKDFIDPIPVSFSFGSATITYGGPFCASGTASVTQTGTTGGTYTASPAGLSINSTTGAINLGASTPATYTVTYTFVTNGCTKTATATVVINAQPTVSVNSPTKCANDAAVTITATPIPAGTYTYVWTVPAGASDPGSVASFSATVAGTYSVTVTKSGCSANGSGSLTVNPNPTVTVNSPTKCANDAAVNITATPGSGAVSDYNYAWTVPAGVTNPGNVQSFSATVAGTYSVIISFKTTSCASASASGSLTVNPNPTVTVNSPTKCANDAAVTITATPGSGAGSDYNYAWTVPAGATNPGNNQSFSATIAGTYSVIITNKTTNCASASANGSLTVNPNPTVTVNSPTKCANDPAVTITATPGSGAGSDYDYAWTVPAGVTNPGNNQSFSATVAGIYSVIITNKTTSCASASGSGTLTVNANPTITLSATPPSINLTNGTTSALGIQSISPGAASDYDFSWSIITKPAGANASLTNANTATPTLNILSPFTEGDYTVQVTATNKTTGCANTASITVPVPAQGAPGCLVTGPSPLCPGSTQTYIYDPNNDNIADAIPDHFTAAWTLVNPNGATTTGSLTGNSVDVIAGSGCNQTFTVRITLTSTTTGATTPCEKIVTVIDNTAPGITCPGPVTVQCAGQVPATDLSLVTATDNCSTPTKSFVSDVISNSSCANRYTITRTYKATDACGNTATCSQTITVNDNTAPGITCPGPVTVQCAGQVPATDLSSVTATDNCGTPTKSFVGDVISNSSCANRYTITRTYKATDACGNTATCSQTITVNDNTAPGITCPGPVTVQCAGQVPPTDLSSVTATDNCGTPTKSFVDDVISNSSCANRYTITRTYKATDACGNTATCSQTITVNDNTPPAFTSCAADAVIECNASTDVVSLGASTATDNCGSVTPTFSDVSTSVGCQTVIIRTWTATDACGNTATCVQHIIKRDRTAPVFNCVASGTPTATDNCTTQANLVIFFKDLGTTRTWTAIDESGNIGTCAQTITESASKISLSGISELNDQTISSQQSEIKNVKDFKIQAYPNPFSDKIKFVVTSPVAGKGNLDVYNMMGQRIKTVYQGFIAAGTQTFELSLPTQQIANLVYVLRIGDKKMSGKILQINQ